MIKIELFTFNPFQENTYVLSNEKGDALIIDPGCYFSAEWETLKNYIKRAGLKPVQLLNTHCHPDHVFGNRWVAEAYHLQPYLHPLDEVVNARSEAASLAYGLSFTNYKGPLHFLQEGDVINLGSDKLEVILTPGHSPGSICFYCAAQHFIISGDVLFRESIGRYDFPGGSKEELFKSITTKLFALPDETVVYSGHGPTTTIGHEKKYNPYFIQTDFLG